MRAHRSTRSLAPFAIALFVMSTLFASPALAEWEWPEWEGSPAEDVVAKGVDAVIVRPLASVRVVVGTLLAGPAILLSSPSGREGIDLAYDTLIAEPAEYAFVRKLGDFQ